MLPFWCLLVCLVSHTHLCVVVCVVCVACLLDVVGICQLCSTPLTQLCLTLEDASRAAGNLMGRCSIVDQQVLIFYKNTLLLCACVCVCVYYDYTHMIGSTAESSRSHRTRPNSVTTYEARPDDTGGTHIYVCVCV